MAILNSRLTPREARARVARRILSSSDTSALLHATDVTPMPSSEGALGRPAASDGLYEGYARVDRLPEELYREYDVKRGLRNADGSGVLVGLTTISNVHGYNKAGGTVVPDEGDLIIRGYRIDDLVAQTHGAGRFGYEEVAYLLVSGRLPNAAELADFNARIDSRRELPTGYLSLFPRTTESSSIMNVLARSTLLLYAFDEDPDSTAAQHEIDVALSLLARLPRIAAIAHEASVSVANGDKLLVPPVRQGYSMAETLLDVLRGAEGFTREEAMMLDVMLMLHAEHGGGNNSTFTTRVLSSSGTDAYSTYAAAMGSLKGPKHGGANAKVGAMIEDVAAHVLRWDDDDELVGPELMGFDVLGIADGALDKADAQFTFDNALLDGLGVSDVDVELGRRVVGVGETHHVGEEVLANGEGCPDVDDAAFALGIFADAVLCLLDCAQRDDYLVVQDLAENSKGDAAVGAREKLCAVLVLEVLDLNADAGLADEQAFRCLGDAAGVGNLFEYGKLLDRTH